MSHPLTARDVEGATFDFSATDIDGNVVISTWARSSAAQMEWSIYQDRLDNPNDRIARVDVCRRPCNLNPVGYWIMRPHLPPEKVSKP